MPRQKKCRRVCFIPENQFFQPIINKCDETIVITIEEVEAIRLSDLEQKEQNQAAEDMNISRGTYQRIINAARFKIADALVNGKAIHIKGGNYEKVKCGGGCKMCGNKCHKKLQQITGSQDE